MQITIDLERSEAAALLRVLRCMLSEDVERALRAKPDTARAFDEASQKLRIALASALGPNGGPQLLRLRDEKEGILRMQASGRWAVCRPGREPVEITSGETFRVEVPSTKELRPTRMEFRHCDRDGGEYFSVDGYQLRDGLRAALGQVDQGRQ